MAPTTEKSPVTCLWVGKSVLTKAILPYVNSAALTIEAFVRTNDVAGDGEMFEGRPVISLREAEKFKVDFIFLATRTDNGIIKAITSAGFAHSQIISLDFEARCHDIKRQLAVHKQQLPFWFCLSRYFSAFPVLSEVLDFPALRASKWLRTVNGKWQEQNMADTPADLPPPTQIPDSLVAEYTLQGKIPVIHDYYDERVSRPTIISRSIYDRTLAAIEARTFKYYEDEVFAFYEAIKDYPFSGKRVLIWGLIDCNCDALALWGGASEVCVVDYNPPKCEHEQVTVITHEELAKSGQTFDVAISFSSFEHDGLGRYGDPLNPSGDFLAMKAARDTLNEDGIMLLGVPVGQDCLTWNAHRIYGSVRLPLLLDGWLTQDVYSIYNHIDIFKEALGQHYQPLLVLKKNNGQTAPLGYINKRMEYAESCLSALSAQETQTVKSPQLLKTILGYQRDFYTKEAVKS